MAPGLHPQVIPYHTIPGLHPQVTPRLVRPVIQQLWCVRTVKKLSWDDEPGEGAAEARDREVGHCAVNWQAHAKISEDS